MIRKIIACALLTTATHAFGFEDICVPMLDMAKSVVSYRDAKVPYDQIIGKIPMISGEIKTDPQTLSYARFASYHIYSSRMTEKDAVEYISRDFCAVHP